MISDFDRSYYFGASDTKYIMNKWNTKTFDEWWKTKRGIVATSVDNIYTQTGNVFEGKILDYLNIEERNQVVVIGRLRVNYDAMQDGVVYEIKTHKQGDWKIPKAYFWQVWVELWASNLERAMLVAYALEEEDYTDYERTIDEDRLEFFPINANEEFISEYLPRLNYLAKCLKEDTYPNESEIG